MSTATMEFADTTKKLGDQIVGLTLKEAKELSDYLKDVHGIEPAAGGAVMMAGPAGGSAAEAPAAKLRGKIPGVSATWQRPVWSASFSIGVHERLQSLVS